MVVAGMLEVVVLFDLSCFFLNFSEFFFSLCFPVHSSNLFPFSYMHYMMMTFISNELIDFFHQSTLGYQNEEVASV